MANKHKTKKRLLMKKNSNKRHNLIKKNEEVLSRLKFENQ